MSPANLSIRQALFTAALLSQLLTGCAGLKLAESSKGLSDDAILCTTPDDKARDAIAQEQSCAQAFERASARRDAISAGQALLIWSSFQDKPLQAASARAALALNPSPWLPKSSGIKPERLQEHAPTARIKRGQLISFGHAPKGAYALETLPAQQKLPSLELQIAAAAGALGVITKDQRVLAATPTLNSMTHTTAVMRPEERERLKLLVDADEALAKDDHLLSAHLLMEATKDAEKSPSQCDGLAVASYSLYLLGKSIFVSDIKDLWSTTKERCVADPEKPDAAQQDHPYWRALIKLEERSDVALLQRLKTPQGLALYLESLNEAKLSSDERSWLELLAQHIHITESLSAHQKQHCVAEEQTTTLIQALDQLGAKFEAAQRQDLAFQLSLSKSWLNAPLKGQALKDKLAKLQAKQRVSGQGWQRLNMQSQLFSYLDPQLDPVDKLLLDPLCQRHSDEIDAQARRDQRHDPASRNAERLIATTKLQGQCSNDRLRPLAEHIIDSLVSSPDGPYQLTMLLGQLSAQAVVLLMQGKSNDILQIGAALLPKLREVRTKLGDSKDERILAAILDVIMRAEQEPQPAAILAQLDQSLRAIDQALSEQSSTKDGMLTLRAPMIRLILSHAQLAASVAFAPTTIANNIQRIERNLEQDLQATFKYLEQDLALVPTTSAHLKLLYSAAALAAAPDKAKLEAELQQAQLITTEEGTRFVGLGLRFVKMGSAIVQAFVAYELHEPELHKRALELSKQSLAEMIDVGLRDFGVSKTNWELLKLLVPAHDLAAAAILSEDDDTSLKAHFISLLPQLEQAAKLSISGIEAQTKRGEPNFVDLFVTGIKATLGVGLIKLYDPLKDTLSTQAQLQIATALEAELNTYSAPLQIYIHTLLAALRRSEPKLAMHHIQQASTLAKGTTEAYLPLLTALRLQGTSPADNLKLLDQALTLQDKRCAAKNDPLAALYVQRAHLLDELGQYEEAYAARQRYTAQVREGYPGDSSLSCQVNASKGYVKANVNLSFPLSSLAQDEDSEAQRDDSQLSTFQFGFGFSSVAEDSEKLECTLQRASTVQYTSIYQLYLDEALIALWRADLAKSNTALIKLLALHERALNTKPHAFDNIAQDRQRFNLAQLRWILTLAQLRGFWQSARELEDAYYKLEDLSALSKERLYQRPEAVDTIKGLVELEPLVNALYPQERSSFGAQEKSIAQALNKQWLSLKAKPQGVTEAHLLLMSLGLTSRSGKAEESKAIWTQLKDKHAKALDPALWASVQAWLEPAAQQDKIVPTFEALLKSNYSAEASLYMKLFRLEQSPAGLARLDALARSNDPQDAAFKSVACFNVLPQLGAVADPATTLARCLEPVEHYQQWDDYTRSHYVLVSILVSQSKWAQAAQSLGLLNAKLSKGLASNHPTMLELLSTQLALKGLAGEPIEDEINAMDRFLARQDEAPEALKTQLSGWHDLLHDQDKLRSELRAYITQRFNPPSP